MVAIACGAALLASYPTLQMAKRLVSQYGHAEIFVVTEQPMPKQFRAPFSRGTNVPLTIRESVLYERAPEKFISAEDIRSIRELLAWKASRPYRPDVLEIHSRTNVSVVARRDAGHSVCITLVKKEQEWVIDAESFATYERMEKGVMDRMTGLMIRTFGRMP